MSQPTTRHATGLHPVSGDSATATAMPTAEDTNSRGRLRMIRHGRTNRRGGRAGVCMVPFQWPIMNGSRIQEVACIGVQTVDARHPAIVHQIELRDPAVWKI